MDVVVSGWLTKSPPEEKMKGRGPFNAKWRKRFCVLYAPPASASAAASHAKLEYYAKEDMMDRRGFINLSECEEIRDHLDSGYYKHLFALQTRTRKYYLAADSEESMNKWVDALIRVLGLRGEALSPVANITPAPILKQMSVPNARPSSHMHRPSEVGSNGPSAAISRQPATFSGSQPLPKPYVEVTKRVTQMRIQETPTPVVAVSRSPQSPPPAERYADRISDEWTRSPDETAIAEEEEEVYNYPTFRYHESRQATDSIYQYPKPADSNARALPPEPDSWNDGNGENGVGGNGGDDHDIYDHPPIHHGVAAANRDSAHGYVHVSSNAVTVRLDADEEAEEPSRSALNCGGLSKSADSIDSGDYVLDCENNRVQNYNDGLVRLRRDSSDDDENAYDVVVTSRTRSFRASNAHKKF